MFGFLKKRNVNTDKISKDEPSGNDIFEKDDKPYLKVSDAVGPIVREGLVIKPVITLPPGLDTAFVTGACAFIDGTEVFTVNKTGMILLDMADGTVTVEEMAERLEMKNDAFEIAMFFLVLGQAGYLENRVELKIYENHLFTEDG